MACLLDHATWILLLVSKLVFFFFFFSNRKKLTRFQTLDNRLHIRKWFSIFWRASVAKNTPRPFIASLLDDSPRSTGFPVATTGQCPWNFDYPFRIDKNAKNRRSFSAAQDLLQWNYHVFLEWKKMKLRGWRCFGFFHWSIAY